MRKFLLLPLMAAMTLFSQAQTVAKQGEGRELMLMGRPVIHPVVSVGRRVSSVKEHVAPQGRNLLKDLSTGTKLNSQRIGSAGNLLTVLDFNCEQLYFDSTLNTVTFIHRVDPNVQPTSNIAQYDFDISKDGGNTWTSNLGPINDSSVIDNTRVNGRFPQAAIYNPAGNTNPDSAYLIYDGTWHNVPVNGTDGSWVGELRGRGHLDANNISSFDVHIDSVNHGITSVATGLHQSQPGVFWNIDEDYTGTFVTGSNAFTRGILVEKGVWNPVTKDVDWTTQEIHQGFDSVTELSGSSNIITSVATSFMIAFDPSGKYGWISCLGDITSNPTTDSVYHPIFWKSTDSGTTWTGPMQVNTDSLPNVINNAASYLGGLVAGANTGVLYEANLTVDYLGNPHLFCVVGWESGYNNYYPYTEFTAYDITYNPSPGLCDTTFQGWQAIYVDSVQTMQGTYTTDASTIGGVEDNRPLVSRSADGTKLFFYWLDTDLGYEGSGTNNNPNNNPNLFTRGFDVAHQTSTPVINLTLGDSLWGGASNASPTVGVFGGACFPDVAPVAVQSGSSYNVPLVLTEIDYKNITPMQFGSGAANNAAAFWYINNITYSKYDFSISNTLTAVITVLGPGTIIDTLNHLYVDSGATFTTNTSCYNPGSLFLVVDSSAVNISAEGTYYIYYSVQDSSGNIYASASRTVVVEAPPAANFASLLLHNDKVQFTDLSSNSPTSWAWIFGDSLSLSTNTSTQQNPSHNYTAPGNYLVCLIATNGVGSSPQYCRRVAVTFVSGVNEVNSFEQDVKLFPNPSSGKVNLTIDGAVMPDFTATVFDVLGNEIAGAKEYKAGTSNVEMDLSGISSGIYMVRIQSNLGSTVKRLVLTGR